MIKYFNANLISNFIKDNKIPFDTPPTVEEFECYLDLYEDSHNARTKWEQLTDDITRHFGGDIQAYFDECHNIQDRILEGIQTNPEYVDIQKSFNDIRNICMSKPQPLNKKKDLYKVTNADGIYLAVDLKEANFQVLKVLVPSVFGKYNTFKEYISQYTTSEYVRSNKNFREVIFGKLQNRLQGLVISSMISDIYKTLLSDFNYKESDPMFVVTDEIAVDFSQAIALKGILYTPIRSIEIDLEHKLKSQYNIDAKVEVIRLECYRLLVKRNNAVAATFYRRVRLADADKSVLKGIPRQYGKIISSLMNGHQPTETDLMFNYEGSRAQFTDTYRIVRVTSDGENGETIISMADSI